MRPRARTPDELDALLEDAFVLRDRRAVAALFESDALLVDVATGQARGAGEIASWATKTWKRGVIYAAVEPRVAPGKRHGARPHARRHRRGAPPP